MARIHPLKKTPSNSGKLRGDIGSWYDLLVSDILFFLIYRLRISAANVEQINIFPASLPIQRNRRFGYFHSSHELLTIKGIQPLHPQANIPNKPLLPLGAPCADQAEEKAQHDTSDAAVKPGLRYHGDSKRKDDEQPQPIPGPVTAGQGKDEVAQ